MKKNIYLTAMVAVIIVFASCGSSSQVTAPSNPPLTLNSDEIEVVQHCNLETDDENYYANAIEVSTNQQMSKDKAKNSARAELAATLKSYVESFTKRYRQDTNGEALDKTEDRLEIKVKQTLIGSIVACDKMTKTTDGKYKSYISMRLNKKDVVDALEKAIKAEKDLNLSFDQATFDKIADEAMKD